MRKYWFHLIIFMMLSSFEASANQTMHNMVSFYKANHGTLKAYPVSFDDSQTKSRRTFVVGDSCKIISPFTSSLIRWHSSLDAVEETSIAMPICECLDGACFSELTRHIPQVFKDKIYRKLSLNGPNCYNATLISAGFLRQDQIRHSDITEIKFYLDTYCEEVSIEDRQYGDIVTVSDSISPIIHTAFYLSDDIAFTKLGPSRSNFFEFENWIPKFHSGCAKAYRCSVPVEVNRNIDILEAENEYRTLIMAGFPADELLIQLDALEKRLHGISTDPSDLASFHAKDSLLKSIGWAKSTLVHIKLKSGSGFYANIDGVDEFKSTFSSTEIRTCDSIAQLKAGYWVKMKEGYIRNNSSVFKSGEFYEVMEIP